MTTRKITIPKPLRKLTEDQLAEVHSWFKRHTYDQILARLRESFGVHMSKTQLCRYFQRFAEANLFNAVLHTPLTSADMAAIHNADPIPEHIDREALHRHLLRLVKSPDINVTNLVQLHAIATYDQRRELKEREQEIATRQAANREEFQKYRYLLQELKLVQSQPEP
jgi:hypothetical protein